MGKLDECGKCGGLQYSLFDKKYLTLNGRCWECDKRLWDEKTLTLEELERREQQALVE